MRSQDLRSYKTTFFCFFFYITYINYNTLNICLPNFDANVFIGKNKNIAVSNGSACTSQIIESSHVLKAMGFSDAECSQTIRISINNETTEFQINELVKSLKGEIKNTNYA